MFSSLSLYDDCSASVPCNSILGTPRYLAHVIISSRACNRKITFRRRLYDRPTDRPTAPLFLQFAEITKVPFPPVYEKFLSIIGIFSFDLGWIMSAACLTAGIDFYDKLL